MARYTTVQSIVDAINAKISERRESLNDYERDELISTKTRGMPEFIRAIVINAFKDALPEKWLGLHGYRCEVGRITDGDKEIIAMFHMTRSHPYYPLASSLTYSSFGVISLKRKRVVVSKHSREKTVLCYSEAVPAKWVRPEKTLFSFFTDAEQNAFARINGNIKKARILKDFLEESGPKKMHDFLDACMFTVFTRCDTSLHCSWQNYELATQHPEQMKENEQKTWERNVLNPHCFDKAFSMYEKDCARFESGK